MEEKVKEELLSGILILRGDATLAVSVKTDLEEVYELGVPNDKGLRTLKQLQPPRDEEWLVKVTSSDQFCKGLEEAEIGTIEVGKSFVVLVKEDDPPSDRTLSAESMGKVVEIIPQP